MFECIQQHVVELFQLMIIISSTAELLPDAHFFHKMRETQRVYYYSSMRDERDNNYEYEAKYIITDTQQQYFVCAPFFAPPFFVFICWHNMKRSFFVITAVCVVFMIRGGGLLPCAACVQ